MSDKIRGIPDITSHIESINSDLAGRGINICESPYNIENDGRDVGARLNELFALPNIDIVFIPNGVYGTSVELVVPNNKTVILSENAEIKALVPMNNMLTIDTNNVRGGVIRGGLLNGNHMVRNILFLKNIRYYKMINVAAKDAKEKAYRLGEEGGQSSYELQMSGCSYHHSGAVPGGLVGVYIENCSDSHFYDILIIGTKKALVTKSWYNFFNLVHSWNSYPQGDMEVAFEVHGQGNMFTNCYADTPTIYGWAFYNQGNTVQNSNVINSPTAPGYDNQLIAFYNDLNYRNIFVGCTVSGNNNQRRIASTFGGSTLLTTAIGITETAVTNRAKQSVTDSFQVKNNEGKSITTTHDTIKGTDQIVFSVYNNYSDLKRDFVIYSNSFSVMNTADDNKVALGVYDKRWSQLYAGTGTINTSDRRHKQQIKAVDDVVLDAWAEVNYTQYKFNDAVEEKGDDARWHIGVIAQDIEEAFNNHGISAFDYGILCYDEWEAEYDEDGKQVRESGSIYSIRPNECLMLESALLRRELASLRSPQ